MKLAPTFLDGLFVCFLSTWRWNAANRHSWYGSYYETRNYFNCPSNSHPVAVNKMISFSSSLTHVVPDKGAAPWDRGWWKSCVGAAASPLTWTLGLQPAQGCCWGRDSSPFASSCAHPAQFVQTLPLSFCSCFHLQIISVLRVWKSF